MEFCSIASFRGALVASAIALAAFATGVQAQTYNYRVAHRFSGAPTDGDYPGGAVQFDASGNLYGITLFGGANNAGTVFKIAKGGTETILHSFDGAAGGSAPSSMTIDPATGNLYGVASEGGDMTAPCDDGCGVLFKLAVDEGTYTVLHNFDGTNDGSHPLSLLRDPQGDLYGTTTELGSNPGTIFRYGANGKFVVIYAFPYNYDGFYPSGGVIPDAAGNLYGVTFAGGSYGVGVVYKLSPDGTLTTLYSFSNGADGGYPNGALVGDEAGNLYGTTSLGGNNNWGTVFKLTPDETFTTLHAFNYGSGGGSPKTGLLRIGGNLYGTTSDGGNASPNCLSYYAMCGAVFKLAPDGTYTVLHSFAMRDGGRPSSALTMKYGRLFGTAAGGGGNSNGTVFSIGMDK